MGSGRFAIRNLMENRGYIAARIVALIGGLAASSCIFMMRYALDYGGYLPNAAGTLPKLALRSYDSLFVATVVYHVDISLLYCFAMAITTFTIAVIVVLVQALTPKNHIYSGRDYMHGDGKAAD